MSESGPKQYSPEQQALIARVETARNMYGVSGKGAEWYQQNIDRLTDFTKVFTYLLHEYDPNNSPFRDQIAHIVDKQVQFQRELVKVERQLARGKFDQTEIDILENIGKQIAKMQNRFNSAKSNQRTAARAEFAALKSAAEHFTAPDHEDEPETEEEDSQPDSATTQASQSGQQSQQQEQQQQQQQKQQTNSGGGGSKGPNGPDTNDTGSPDPDDRRDSNAESAEEFEFDPDMLKTEEGRWKVFREMAFMFNQVLHRRDILGFSGYKGLQNKQFDGFVGVYRRYPMMKEFIRSLSKRGKGVASIDIGEAELEDFKEGYYKLKSYYDRTNAFYEQANSDDAQKEQSEKEKARKRPKPEPKPGPGPGPGPEPEQGRAWEKRLELKRDWRAKKDAYDAAYKTYLDDLAKERENRSVLRKLQFWRKDSQPSELLRLEEEYLNASSAYVAMLHPAMENSRFVTKTLEEKFPKEDPKNAEEPHGVKTWLTHLFVVNPAHEKLEVEKLYVPQGIAARNLKAMQEIMKKHGKTLTKTSWALTIGAGVVTGGLFGAVAALVGKTQAVAWIGGGSIAGAAVLGGVGQLNVNKKQKQLDTSLSDAFLGFKASNISALKKMYENNYRAYQQAVKNQRTLAVGGAIAGGLAGAALSGHFDEGAINIPDLEPTSPELLVPDTDLPEEIPESPEKEIPEDAETLVPDAEPVVPPEVETGEPGKLDNLEKGDTDKNGAIFEPEPDVKDIDDLSKEDADMNDPSPHEKTDNYIYYEEAPNTETVEYDEHPLEEAMPELLYTFEPGDRVNTVSEALFESWKEDHSLVEDRMSKNEFLSEMYKTIAELESDPLVNRELLEQMGVTSGDIDKVQVGQTIDLQPFFEYMNNRH